MALLGGNQNPGGVAPDRLAGQTLGKYELGKIIGRGTCGVVYHSRDPFIGRDVAIKISNAAEDDDPAHSQHQARAFFTEAKAAGRLQHPHIVSVYDAGIANGHSFIVMEYVEGKPLSMFLRQPNMLPPATVVGIMFNCARALDYSFRRGVLHRDIKPANIMLCDNNVPKIMDFSIAAMVDQTGRAGGVVGSPAYMSPEQLRDEVLGSSADLYALGAVMFHLLTGKPPFVAQEMTALFNLIKTCPAPRLSTVRPELPAELDDIIARLLDKDPANRYQSGLELASHLTRVFDSLRYAERVLIRKENRNELRGLRFFDGFEDQDIEELLAAADMISFRPGEMIIKEGEMDNAFFILARGEVDIIKGSSRLMTMTKGDVFGEIGFLSPQKRTASVVAKSDALTLKLNAAAMDNVSEGCQLRYYKVFCETLIYRLSMTSAKLVARS